METITSVDQHKLVSSFVEIAVGYTMETTVQFLEASNWNLEDAINLLLIHRSNQPRTYQYPLEQSNNSQVQEQIHLPLPSRKDTLYDDPSTDPRTSVLVCSERICNSTTPPQPDSTLSSLYLPPLGLFFEGLFEDAKSVSFKENRWLLVNLQSETEPASHALNKDLWSNEVVSQVIKSSFLLLQVYDDTDEGKKVSSFYEVDSVYPVILLIDPFTGQKMRTWSGVIKPHRFLVGLIIYMDSGPNQFITSLPTNKRTRTEGITSSPSNKRTKIEKITCSPSNDPVEDSYPEGSDALFSYAKEETYSSSNDTDNPVSPSWGSEFEEAMIMMMWWRRHLG